MAVTDVSSLRKKRKQKHMTRLLKRLLIILAVCAAAGAVVLTKDRWYGYLDGILAKIPAGEQSSELAGGNFPLTIEGGSSYQLELLGSHIGILDDSHFFSYNLDGRLVFSRQHAFSSPILAASDEKALIYDLGGKNFSLMSKYDSVYEKTAELPILLARLSGADQAAVVMTDDKFMSRLMIYDRTGKNIFNYNSVSRIIDVSFDAENAGCYITLIGSEGGEIVSHMVYYKFDRINHDHLGNPVPVFETGNFQTLALKTSVFGDGIIVIGDTGLALYDKNGVFIKSYSYEYTLSGYNSSETVAAMIFRDESQRNSLLITVESDTGTVNRISLDGLAESVAVSGDMVFVHIDGGISAYAPAGEFISSVSAESDFDRFRPAENYFFLLGYDRIDRMDF